MLAFLYFVVKCFFFVWIYLLRRVWADELNSAITQRDQPTLLLYV